MAGIEFKTEFDKQQFLVFRKLADTFPEIRAEMLGFVGHRGKKILFNNYFRGQELMYKSLDMEDEHGRRTVSYSIAKKAMSVKIRSYPANLFEKGRRLRSGDIEPGKFIITRKFKSVMSARLNGILSEYDRMHLQRKIDRVAA